MTDGFAAMRLSDDADPWRRRFPEPTLEAERCEARGLRVGQYIELSRNMIEFEDKVDWAVDYEQVVYIEPITEAYEVHTESHRLFFIGDDLINVLKKSDEPTEDG